MLISYMSLQKPMRKPHPCSQSIHNSLARGCRFTDSTTLFFPGKPTEQVLQAAFSFRLAPLRRDLWRARLRLPLASKLLAAADKALLAARALQLWDAPAPSSNRAGPGGGEMVRWGGGGRERWGERWGGRGEVGGRGGGREGFRVVVGTLLNMMDCRAWDPWLMGVVFGGILPTPKTVDFSMYGQAFVGSVRWFSLTACSIEK